MGAETRQSRVAVESGRKGKGMGVALSVHGNMNPALLDDVGVGAYRWHLSHLSRGVPVIVAMIWVS